MTFDHGLSTHKGTRGDFSLSDSNACKLAVSEHHAELPIPSGLVVSADDSICATLGEILLRCCVVPVFAETVREAAQDLTDGKPHFVICQDTLRDGSYADLLRMQLTMGVSLPFIVISLSGDWPEYFQAVDDGAYDFLAYPLIPGELERIIGNFRCSVPNEPTSTRLQHGRGNHCIGDSPK
jgi:DNA-binding NtrC family response regulator